MSCAQLVGPSRPHRRLLTAACGALLLTSAACQRPRFEGPQLQDPPSGFLYKNGAASAQQVFPDREIVQQGAWTKGGGQPFSAIFITSYRGVATPEETLEARDNQENRLSSQDYQFGRLERMVMDGHEAWGWMVSHQDSRGLHSREFKVTIPHDSMTYTVEFFTNKTGMKDNPDTLRWGVASFAVGVTTVNRRAIVIGSVLGGFFLIIGIQKFRADPFAANRNMRLAQFPVPETDEGEPSPEPPRPT